MNALNNSVDDVVECPLCMEPLEVDDLNFFPCTCGYQICRFCWHRIRTDENELCPACRKEYPENPADFTPLTQEEMIAFKSQKRQRDQQRKQKITENRKHLANVRVVQKNLVFVVGLPPRLADAEVLKKHEYFGKYGKIHKVVINPSTTYAGVQGPSASAYVTYVCNSDALRAIQSVNNISIDGRLVKTSLGTTKYCSHFMKNQQCPKNDCMYLHELGDPEASFTKEEMHLGKHQEYEKRLHDSLIASSNSGTALASNSTTSASIGSSSKNSDGKSVENGSFSSSSSGQASSNPIPMGKLSSGNNKEVWPSLSVSPVNVKDTTPTVNTKKKGKNEKNKSEKSSKNKNRNNQNTGNHTHSPNKDNKTSSSVELDTAPSSIIESKSKSDKSKGHVKAAANRTNNKESQSTDKKNAHSSVESETQEPTESSKIANAEKMLADESALKQNSSFKSQDSDKSANIENVGDVQNSSLVSTEFESSIEQALRSRSDENSDEYQKLTDCTETNIDEFNIDFKNSDNINDQNELKIPVLPSDNLSGFDPNLNTAAFNKLSMFDDCNSLFSSAKSKLDTDSRVNQSHLPDLLNGIDEYQRSRSTSRNDFLQTWTDFRRLSQAGLLGQQQHGDLINNAFANNMSKFFDFHKNQQNLQTFPMNPRLDGGMPERMRMEQNHINMPLIDQQLNCFMSPLHQQQQQQMQQHQHDKFEFSHHVGPLPPQMDVPPQPQQPQQQQQQQSHMNMFSTSASIDDELGFDPFTETRKALAELMENEIDQKLKSCGQTNSTLQNDAGSSKNMYLPQNNHNLQYQQQMLETAQHRARMPPPGFNHMHAFGFGGLPRMQQSNPKMLPFMSAGAQVNNSQNPMHPLHNNTWNTNHLSSPPTLNDTQIPSNAMSGYPHKGYTNNDWTAMDPAILSLRQFPFSQHHPMNHPQQHDLYMHNHVQQQQQQGPPNPGFVGPHGQIPAGVNLSNNGPQVNSNVQGMLEYLKTRQFV